MDRRIQKLDETLRAAAVSLIVLLTTSAVQANDFHCTPALPVFCANVHVGCAGRTAVPTRGFKVSPSKIAFNDGGEWKVDISVSDSGSVYRRTDGEDWIRVDPTGAFSQRIYRKAGPLMTYGTCK